MRPSVRLGLLLILLLTALLALESPAWSQGAQPPGEAFVVLSGPADVPAGKTVNALVVFQGSSTVDGTVNGSLTAFNAPVTISGRVNGDVTVFNGRVELRSGATVTGDVSSQQAPVVAQGATIGGTTRGISGNLNWNRFGWVSRVFWWLAITVSTLVVGLLLVWLVGRGAEGIPRAGRGAVGPAIGWGLLLFVGLPILAVVAMVTVVGLPFGLGLLAALGLIYAIGYGAGAWVLGRSLVRPPTAWVAAFLAGWAILRVLALVPFLAGVVWFAAVVYGLGALVVALWRARTGGRAAVGV
jgi:cytoskeletal protein CcmA (bactofilin family)